MIHKEACSEMKEKLVTHIRQLLADKLQSAKTNFDSIRESLESEGKSTAGDKHETGRAMVQLELEQAGKIIREAEETILAFSKLNFSGGKLTASGSLVHTDQGLFFLGIALGKIAFEGQDVFCVGTLAPLFKLFAGKKTGETVSFGKQSYRIIGVE